MGCRHYFAVILSEVEGPLDPPPVSNADNDYWIYIVSNNTRSTLYIGLTSELRVRVWQHRVADKPGSFSERYHCVHLVYYEHYREVRMRSHGKSS